MRQGANVQETFCNRPDPTAAAAAWSAMQSAQLGLRSHCQLFGQTHSRHWDGVNDASGEVCAVIRGVQAGKTCLAGAWRAAPSNR